MTKKRKQGKVAYRKLKRPAKIGFLGYVGDTQGCGTIRVIYPYFLMNHIMEKDLMIHSSYLLKYIADPNFYKDFTIVQFQRSATKEHLQLFHHFKHEVQSKFKIPMVYEIDDLLINIPKWNYASPYYKENEEYVKQMLSMANAIVTSTEKLKETYLQFNPKIAVIPNHLPKFIWQEVFPAHEYKDESKRVKILYAGSQNHFPMPFMKEQGLHGGDFGEKLMDFIRKTTDKYEWIFMGAMPVELNKLKQERKITFHKWENIFNYPRKLKEIEPDICLASLQQNVFNQSKSNIKSLEYAALGAPGVYTDIDPYHNMTLRTNNDEEFISYIEKLADDINFRAEVWNKDYKTVEGQLWWEENGNVKKYVNTYLNLFGNKL